MNKTKQKRWQMGKCSGVQQTARTDILGEILKISKFLMKTIQKRKKKTLDFTNLPKAFRNKLALVLLNCLLPSSVFWMEDVELKGTGNEEKKSKQSVVLQFNLTVKCYTLKEWYQHYKLIYIAGVIYVG